MSGGDSANAELGIAIQDAIAADARMQGRDGIAAQQAWGVEYLSERMMGMAAALAVVATPMIFLHASPRAGVVWVGGLFLLAMVGIWSRADKTKEIDVVRAAQLAAHRSQKQTNAGASGSIMKGD